MEQIQFNYQTKLLQNRNLSHKDKLVGCILLYKEFIEGMYNDINSYYIHQITGFTEKTINKSINVLQAYGFITVNQTNQFKINYQTDGRGCV